MSDIVERLRNDYGEWHPPGEASQWRSRRPLKQLRHEAADEIGRLRERLSHAWDTADRCDAERHEARAAASQPVAWRCLAGDGVSDVTDRRDIADQWLDDGLQLVPLYTAAIRALKAQDVVSSAPQPTTEGTTMGDPEKTDLAVEIANLVGKAIEQGADVDEVKAVLNEVLDELEAQDNGDDEEEPPKEDGENA